MGKIIKRGSKSVMKEVNVEKIVFFQGTFDLLNAGHVRAFKVSRSMGDRLVVGLNSDSLIRWFKKREPIVPYRQRFEIIKAIKWVDEVIRCDEPAAINYLKKLDASVYVLTEEWKEQQAEAIAYMEEKGGRVYYSPRYADIFDSTTLRNRVIEFFGKEVGEERVP